ncbi:Transcription factor bHLH104 [Zea mays]|uniref:Transcription factor bHLH104 n=1 Tax=Zea mays TaxID=4577 RepID=B4FH11_MAIZE|nr:unknown [Zea mays]ACL53988.1 unknown [Zea mays]AQK86397.1 Transcription factor bHLH104 [Zea mays]
MWRCRLRSPSCETRRRGSRLRRRGWSRCSRASSATPRWLLRGPSSRTLLRSLHLSTTTRRRLLRLESSSRTPATRRRLRSGSGYRRRPSTRPRTPHTGRRSPSRPTTSPWHHSSVMRCRVY